MIHVVVDSCGRADGTNVHRELVLHPGAAAVLPLLDDDRVLLVFQYRRPLDERLWEIPAGKLEPGEAPLACAKRELAEETGRTAATWRELLTFYTTPGFSNERITLFLARDLAESSPPETEEIDRCQAFTIEELVRMIRDGELRDAKTILAIEHHRASLDKTSRRD
ncbi:NUDIX hydrolase [Candidatus Bipolaricaulota bacterium]